MACTVKPKKSMLVAKVELLEKGIIDNNNNILKGKEADFQNLANKNLFNANLKYGIERPLYFKNGKKVAFNTKAFQYIDAKNGVFYPENYYAQALVQAGQEPERSQTKLADDVKETMMGFLKTVNPNFRVEILDEVNDGQGQTVNGVLKLSEFLIQIRKGEEMSLPEESAHVLVEMLNKNSALYRDLMDNIVYTKAYKKVLYEYGDHPEYRGNYDKLKREAAAKLISYYFYDKGVFENYAGGASVLSKMRLLINRIIRFFKTGKFNLPYTEAALRIVNRDMSDILYNQALTSEHMYQLGELFNISKLVTLEEDADDYDFIYINLNDTVLNLKDFTPSKAAIQKVINNFKLKGLTPPVYLSPEDVNVFLEDLKYSDDDISKMTAEEKENIIQREKEKIAKKSLSRVKAKMWFSEEFSPILEEYYSSVRLTQLGLELKDKWGEVGEKIIFYTEAGINESMLNRLQNEFGADIGRKVININTGGNLTEEAVAEEEGVEEVFGVADSRNDNLSGMLKGIEQLQNKKVLLVDNKKNFVFSRPKEYSSVKPTLYSERAFRSLNLKKNGVSFYLTIAQVEERIRKNEEAAAFSRETLEELERQSPESLLKIVEPALKVLNNLIAKVENNEGDEAILEAFKDKNGNTILPIETTRNIIKQIREQGPQMKEGLISFVNTVSSVTYFWKNANTNDGYKKLLPTDLDNPEEVTKAIHQIADLKRLALYWGEYFETLKPLMASEQFNDLKIIPNILKNLQYEVQLANTKLNEVATTVLSHHFAGAAKNYNLEKKRQLDAGIINQKQYNESVITPERLAKVLLGREGDVSVTAYFETSAFIDNPIIQAINYYVSKAETIAEKDALDQALKAGEELGKLEKELGMNSSQVGEKITYIDKTFQYVDGVRVPMETLTFLHATKNEYRLEEELNKVEELKEKWYEALSTGQPAEEIERLKADYQNAYNEFISWRSANWNNEIATEKIQIYRDFGLEGPDLDRAMEAQEQISVEIRQLESNLRTGTFTLMEQAEVQERIQSLISQLRNLRNPWSTELNRMKEEDENPVNDIRVAIALQKKNEIDRQLSTITINQKQFLKDLSTQLLKLDPDDAAKIRNLINVKNPTWLKEVGELAGVIGNYELIEWIDKNTRVVNSERFYENRRDILDRLKVQVDKMREVALQSSPENAEEVLAKIEVVEQLRQESSEQWKEIMNMSSALRDEDGVFDAASATLEQQKKIKEVEQRIDSIKYTIREILKPKQPIKGESFAKTAEDISKENPELERINSNIKEIFDELSQLQMNTVTTYYNEVMFDKLSPIFPRELGGVFAHENFDEFVNSLNFKEYYVDLIERNKMGRSYLSKEESDFLNWFISNHKIRTYMDEYSGETNFEFTPTYIWRKIEPKDGNDVIMIPGYKYSSRELKDKASVEFEGQTKDYQLKTEKIDFVTWNPITRKWLPKAVGEFRNEEYFKLKESTNSTDRKLFEYLTKVTELSLKNQMDAPKSSRLGYTVPFLAKRHTEGNSVGILIKDFNNKLNRVEQGDANSQMVKEEKKTLFDRLAAWVNLPNSDGTLPDEGDSVMTMEGSTDGNPVKKVQTDLLGNRVQTIYTNYTGYEKPDDVTRDTFSAVISYVGGISQTKAVVGQFKELTLTEQILEEYPPVEKDVISKSGVLVPTKTNTTLQIVQNIKKTKLFGDVKDYELGRQIENFTQKTRTLTVIGSQSLLNPSNSMKNYIQGQLTNLISGGFGTWATAKSLFKAMRSPHTSYVTYLAELKKENKSKDFLILTEFNLHGERNLASVAAKTAYQREMRDITKLGMLGTSATEFSIASTLLYGHLFEKDIEIDGKPAKLYDVFEVVNGVLTTKPNAYDGGRLIDNEYIIDLKIKAKVMMEQVQGKKSGSSYADRWTLFKNIEFYKQFFIPKLRESIGGKRVNLALGEDLQGHYQLFAKYALRELLSLIRDKKLSSMTGTPQEKRAAVFVARQLLSMVGTYMLISFVFGYDDDDEERFKKLKENSWLTNFMLLTMLNAKRETDSLSFIPLFNIQENLTPPIISETWDYITNPFLGLGVVEEVKSVVNALASAPFDSGYYKVNRPQSNIEIGDSKLLHELWKISMFDSFFFMANPEYKIFNTQQQLNR
jgi:hypothetical protein